VVLLNHRVVTFRGALGANSAADRAAAATGRIEAALQANEVPTVGTRSVREGVLVTVNDRPVFTVTAAEADTAAGITLAQAAATAAQRLQLAIDAAREQSSWINMLRAGLFALLATAVFVLLLRLLRTAKRRLKTKLLQFGRSTLPTFTIRGVRLFERHRVIALLLRTAEGIFWGAGLFLAYLWLTFVLTQFPYSRPWGEALGNYLAATLATLAVGALHAIPGLFTVLLIVVLTRFLTRLITTFFQAVEQERVAFGWLHPDTLQPTRRIVVALLWLFAIAVSYPYLPGSDSDVFKGVSIFAGLLVTLGSTSVVSQAMSGLVLMYSRALKAGEYVLVGEIEGTVYDVGILATKVRTPKNELVTIPNAVVVGSSTKNYSRLEDAGQLLLYTTVTIGYDAPWRQVQHLLRRAAERTPGLLREPAPFVLQTALSDFYVEYQVNAALARPETRPATLAALHENILDEFTEAGIQIMSPHFRSQPDAPVLPPSGSWSRNAQPSMSADSE
jgi:small-conductance mechanosensitive channel